MGDLVDAIGAGFLPSSSPPVISAISSVATDMEFPNVASSATAEGGTATARVIEAAQKKFFFDLGSNAHGQYLHISEVRFLLTSGSHLTASIEVVLFPVEGYLSLMLLCAFVCFCVQVTGVDCSAIILPDLALEKFHETLGQFVNMVKSQGLVGSSEANVHTIAPQWKRSEG